MFLKRRMKHFLIGLVAILVGKHSNLICLNFVNAIIGFVYFLVFSLYKSLSANEDEISNNNVVNYELTNDNPNQKDEKKENIYKELELAKEKIKLLESKIKNLEDITSAKKYEDVKFLNYQNRKRILVCCVIFDKIHGNCNIFYFF